MCKFTKIKRVRVVFNKVFELKVHNLKLGGSVIKNIFEKVDKKQGFIRPDHPLLLEEIGKGD